MTKKIIHENLTELFLVFALVFSLNIAIAQEESEVEEWEEFEIEEEVIDPVGILPQVPVNSVFGFGQNIVEAPLMNFAFRILPTLIFFSSLINVLYHLGVMQFLVKSTARIMLKTMGTSGSETLCISGNIFVGQTEAPLLVQPFVSKMTNSELTAVMIGGFATVAGGVMAMYVSMLGDIDGIAGHLLAASIMSAPAALVVAKIIYPETEESQTKGDLTISNK